MASKIKVTKKELKQPDKFRRFVGYSIALGQRHYPKVVALLLIILLALFTKYFLTSLISGKELKANRELQEIIDTYMGKEGGKDLDGAPEKFLALSERYPNIGVGKIAIYYAALANYKMGKYEESIKLFEKFLSSGVKDEFLKSSALYGVGMASFGLKKWDEAVRYLEKVNSQDSPFRDQARIHIGIAYEKLGEFEKANSIYREMLKQM
jgi:outer membrane protein assembly factor BamD (BamD/ComL family)